MMKIWLSALVVLLVGLGLGAAAAWIRDAQTPGLRELDIQRLLDPNQAADNRQPTPKAQVDKAEYDFGTMDSRSEGKHGFVIKNTGSAPLKLSLGSTTCKCAWSALKKDTLAPGESTVATIKWTPKDFVGPFEQIARIGTNDPLRPLLLLKIKGRVTTVVRLSPNELVFSGLPVGQSMRGEALLYAYSSDSMKTTGYELLEPDTAQFFDVELSPLPIEQVRAEKDAKSGAKVSVMLKSGLPQGPFHQTIRIRTNLESAPTVDLPIRGQIASDISIMGPGWDDRWGQVRMGMVDGEKGAQRELDLVVRGRFRRTIECEVLETSPPGVLEAELGEKKESGQSGKARIPLTIRIPKGTGPANHLGLGLGEPGYVLIGTTHPKVPKIKILVCFAVEGG
ncbi:MAG: DUF1573 domain-containing protein [Pirellulales bacterium]|nr:DUF1573 domain-containing protein [Pirellulales bacterium]